MSKYYFIDDFLYYRKNVKYRLKRTSTMVFPSEYGLFIIPKDNKKEIV